MSNDPPPRYLLARHRSGRLDRHRRRLALLRTEVAELLYRAVKCLLLLLWRELF